MLIFDPSYYYRELLNYIIRVDQQTWKYIVKSLQYPEIEVSADSFYSAIEEFEKCVISRESIELLNKREARPTSNEILVTIAED